MKQRLSFKEHIQVFFANVADFIASLIFYAVHFFLTFKLASAPWLNANIIVIFILPLIAVAVASTILGKKNVMTFQKNKAGEYISSPEILKQEQSIVRCSSSQLSEKGKACYMAFGIVSLKDDNGKDLSIFDDFNEFNKSLKDSINKPL